MAAPKVDLALPDPSPRDMHLPPTPPEDYSDENKNRLQTPPMQTLQQLLTPDNTPPGMVLQPPRPLLSRDPSSRADSFRTAREELSHEFLRAVDEAGSQVEDEESSGDESLHNGEHDTLDDEPWRDIPGAFRNTPSTTSSEDVEEPVQSLGPMSSPSTGSSDEFVRPKQYLDIESPPSTGSSRNIERTRRYRHDTESPSDRHKPSENGRAGGSISYAHSAGSSDEDSEDSDADEEDDEDAHEEGDHASVGHDFDHANEGRDDWDNHVSYLALGVKEHEDAVASARASPSSSRLSGNGRRVGVNGAQPLKGVNNPPLATSATVPEQGLLKRASDESSHQRSDNTPSPSVSAQKRKQMAATSKEAATPREARELRRILMNQHAGTDIPAEFLATPPRNANDTVYKHIQQANMDRFDAMKNGHAVEAVVVSTDSARNRHLRHVTKRQSLRSVSDNNSSYMPSGAPKRESSLRPKKAMTPQKKVPQPSGPESPQTTRSASGSHSLRHEKRPLSGTGRPLQSNDNSPALSRAKEPLKLRHKPPSIAKEPPRLRHSSLPIHLNSEPSQVSPISLESANSERRRAHALRRSSREYRIENKNATAEPAPEQKPVSTIIETTTFTSPHLLGLGTQSRSRSRGTPLSVSAVSDRTEMEVCEAQNVAFYPHSNNSLLVVQHRSKPEQKDQGTAHSPPKTKGTRRLSDSDNVTRLSPLFPEAATQDTPAIAVNGKSIHTVESPLTNPRAAPMPPVINFIPPTPSHEDEEKELVPVEEEEIPSTPQRKNSLAKRARRYSEVVVRPLFGRTLVTRSHNIRPSPTASEKRDERLHPNWVPNSFWQDDDDDDDEYYSDPDDPFVRLPAGGDTSEHPKSKFPRNMSVRMPGFRGSGGFLLGNSLGVDRHGTNKRRPYIEPPSGNGSTAAPKHSVRRVASLDSMASHASGDGRIFVIPGTRTRLQYVGFKPIKDKIKKRRETREDAAREKRRAEIKDQIGMRIVHDA
ncbi:hypothetical protein Q7P35_003834 [Cladosporium inversicolor]